MRTGGIILFPGCSNKCVFCEPEGIPFVGKLSNLYQGWKAKMNIREFEKEGIEFVEISGGDPLEYPGLLTLVETLKKKGKTIQLSSHGRQLKDIEFLKRLKDAGLDKLRIPLYAADETHDKVTQAPGSFEETLAGIKNAVSLGIPVQISCLILKENKDSMIGLLDLVHGLGIKDVYISIPCLANGLDFYYIPIKDLPSIVRPLQEHAMKIGMPLQFREIPYCVFEEIKENIHCTDRPPELKYMQPDSEVRSKEKDWPEYRIKTKAKICEGCSASDRCDGLFKRDIDKYGTGELRTIQQPNERSGLDM